MTEKTQKPTSTAKLYALALRDLEVVAPFHGAIKMLIGLTCLLTTSIFAMQTDSYFLFAVAAVLSGIAYAYTLIPTHDAIHYTLTGNKWADEIYSRIVSYPIFWTHGIYAEVHKLHHRMNGIEARDPERKNPTKEEYFHKNIFVRHFYRHRFFWDVFIFGGFGLIVVNVLGGLKFRSKSKALRREMTIDFAGIALWQVGVLVTLGPMGLAGKYYIMFLIWERITGAILQYRAHIEHDALDPHGENMYEKQITGCRNIVTNEFWSRFYNRLTYHSVHHAFPRVPFYNLKEAHKRILKIAEDSGLQVPEDQGYLKAGQTLLTTHHYYETDEKGKITKAVWVNE